MDGEEGEGEGRRRKRNGMYAARSCIIGAGMVEGREESRRECLSLHHHTPLLVTPPSFCCIASHTVLLMETRMLLLSSLLLLSLGTSLIVFPLFNAIIWDGKIHFFKQNFRLFFFKKKKSSKKMYKKLDLELTYQRQVREGDVIENG